MRLSGLTLSPLTAQNGVERWILSLRDSHASHFHQQVAKREQKMSVIYGLKSQESLAKYDQNTSSWKMFQESLNGSCQTYSKTFPNWGLMRHGVLYEQVIQERHTEDQDGSYGLNLIPKPTVSSGAQTKENPTPKQTGGTTLKGYVKMFPTPTTSDGMRTNLTHKKGNNPTLKGSVITDSKTIGKLNPQWVAWLMGLPTGWINCEYWGME